MADACGFIASTPTPSSSFDLDALAPAVDCVAALLRQQGARLVTAESCTGGLIAAACTAVSGSSDWFDRGFVTYSNAAKSAELGVPAQLIAAHGAVSEPVARAMATGAQKALADGHPVWSVAVTGIAGPSGGSPDKPVGLVWMAIAGPGAGPREGPDDESGTPWIPNVITFRDVFAGSRADVRSATVRAALSRLQAALGAATVNAKP